MVAMSRYYEVKKRDGAARIGRLITNDEQLQTPFLFHVESTSSIKEIEVIGAESPRFTTLTTEDGWDNPRATVLLPDVHPLYPKTKESPLFVDIFVLGFASSMLNTPEAFVRRVIDARREIPPDVALWVPAIATAENAALLVYMGVDIIDSTNAIIKGYSDIYQLEDCELQLSDLEELPCNCPVCASTDINELRARSTNVREKIAGHNTLLLERELSKIREYIRAGTLREYVESCVRSSTFLTAVLRILDAECEYFEPRTPIARKRVMKINTMESLRRIEVRRFANRVLERYTPPTRRILLILPCASKKPYSISRTHRKFISAIADYRGHVHELILTSPLGVVPRELELVYPAAFYDIPVTGYWDAEERAWVASCLSAYLDRNIDSYDVIVAHLRAAYREICESVAEEKGIEMIFTCEEHEKEVSDEAIERLRNCITELCGANRSRSGIRAAVIKAMADYQFGAGTGDELLNGGTKVVGKYPALRLATTEGVLARVVPEYGLLALSVAGARRIERITQYKVEIDDDFMPKGAILAPGVLSAGEEIRANDEVIFYSARAFGVGRAKMSGYEMVESNRGVAIDVRDVVAL